VSILGLIVGLALAASALAAPSRGDSVGTLRFADASGQAITLDAPGVVYLVDFWALGCKPCIAEMPDLERLAKEYEPSRRFRLVTVVYGGWKGADLKKVAANAGTKLPVYADPDNWHDRLGVDAYPTKFLIRDGKLITRARGGGTGSYAAWSAAVADELKRAP